jgi:hypothetical protein
MFSHFIPEPFQFNPLKHHLAFIRQFVCSASENVSEENDLIRQVKHIGTSVMDIYTGSLTVEMIMAETDAFLISGKLHEAASFAGWVGKSFSDYRVITISDNSHWTLKYHGSQTRYVHLFPARTSPHSFRIKANTLKSAVLYEIMIGRDYINEEDLNRARAIIGLSPVKDVAESEAIYEMIEILRQS